MRVIVLFNLKPGVSAEDYERWAKETDIPGVRGLASVSDFQVYRTTGLLGSDARPAYAYVEIIDIPDMERFGADLADEAVQAVAAQFAGFADAPQFILTEAL